MEAVTETSSATAWAPFTPSAQPAMPMLTMLLPFIAAMSSSEAAWLILFMPMVIEATGALTFKASVIAVMPSAV